MGQLVGSFRPGLDWPNLLLNWRNPIDQSQIIKNKKVKTELHSSLNVAMFITFAKFCYTNNEHAKGKN